MNDGQSLLNAAIAGLGIAYLPSFLYADALAKGQVEEAFAQGHRTGITGFADRGGSCPEKALQRGAFGEDLPGCRRWHRH